MRQAGDYSRISQEKIVTLRSLSNVSTLVHLNAMGDDFLGLSVMEFIIITSTTDEVAHTRKVHAGAVIWAAANGTPEM